MAEENPYQSPPGESGPCAGRSLRFYWRIPLLLFAAVIATVPFYGYFVHAARDSQQIALLIFFCWILSWTFAIGSAILAAVRPPGSSAVRFLEFFLVAYLILAGFIGLGGVRNAFYELIAG